MQKIREGVVPDQFRTSLFFKNALYEIKVSGLQLSFNIFLDNLAYHKSKLFVTLDY